MEGNTVYFDIETGNAAKKSMEEWKEDYPIMSAAWRYLDQEETRKVSSTISNLSIEFMCTRFALKNLIK